MPLCDAAAAKAAVAAPARRHVFDGNEDITYMRKNLNVERLQNKKDRKYFLFRPMQTQ